MKFDSLTVQRNGAQTYKVTVWSDGVIRWDGDSGPRAGAWQTFMDPDWLDALGELIASLPVSKKQKAGDEGSLVLETSKGRTIHPLRRAAKPPEVWRLAMVLDGACENLAWMPLDVTGEADFSRWASGTWLTLQQGAALGRALAQPQGVLLLAGSIASASTAPTLEDNYKAVREGLIEDAGFELSGDRFVLKRHILFSSPSAPASVLAGSNTNGRRAWRDEAGSPWAELYPGR